MLRSPVFWYLSVTLGVPLLRGRLGQPGFAAHALTVLAICAIALVVRRAAGAPERDVY